MAASDALVAVTTMCSNKPLLKFSSPQVKMASPEEIAEGFVNHYLGVLHGNREEMAGLYVRRSRKKELRPPTRRDLAVSRTCSNRVRGWFRAAHALSCAPLRAPHPHPTGLCPRLAVHPHASLSMCCVTH